MLSKVLVNGLAALQNGTTIFEALDLFYDEACCVDFVFFRAVDRYYALSVFFLLV